MLDLDHTLLNSTREAEVPAGAAPALARLLEREVALEKKEGEEAAARERGAATAADAEPAEPPARSSRGRPGTPYRAAPPLDAADPPPPPPPLPSRTLFHLPHLGLWTKLRPGCRPFLARAATEFELAVYTHGDRAYAAAMAGLLDPDGSLFGGRVISQGDSTAAHHKSLDVTLGDDAGTLILDDTAAVWPTHGANLILVDRYIFFPACAGRFARGRSLLEAGLDEDGARGMLSVARAVLGRVHTASFEAAAAGRDPDVRTHHAAERARVLAGCRVVLSGLAPLGTDVRTCAAARVATSLGATVDDAVTPTTTHVVAAADGTSKAVAARAAGASLVSPAWLDACVFRWARAREADFPPPPPGAERAPLSAAADLAAAAAAAGGGRGR